MNSFKITCSELGYKWDARFIVMAHHVSLWSKDPSTKTGAVIVRPDKTIVSVGYNGFPRGIADPEYLYDDREYKYPRIVHAEVNAILNAKDTLKNTILYQWPASSCSDCCKMVIQAGIKTVVNPKPSPDYISRWGKEDKLTKQIFNEANITYLEVDINDNSPIAKWLRFIKTTLSISSR